MSSKTTATFTPQLGVEAYIRLQTLVQMISMIPGIPGGRVNPRQAKMLMKQLGYKELEDVEEVIIRTAEKELVIRAPSVAEMNVQGQQMYQVVGTAEEMARGEGGVAFPEEDVQLVAERAGVSPEEARRALEECGGEPAEAIIMLMKG